MANYTQHYHLHQWEPEDSFLRTDFNGDFRPLTPRCWGLSGTNAAQPSGGTQGMGS
ncbi:MAG: hypothetical protein V8S11_14370 [Flavonifractor plautii]